MLPPERSSPSDSKSPSGSASTSGAAADDVDAHLVEHRHGVLDLLRGDLIRREHRVELVIRHVAALLGAGHHLLHCRGHAIHEGTVAGVASRLALVLRLLLDLRLRRHAVLIPSWK
jgi:hypothetical protein